VLNQIQRSRARCDAVSPIRGSSLLAKGPLRPWLPLISFVEGKMDWLIDTVCLIFVCYANLLIDSWLHNELQVALIGPKLDLTYDYEASGSGMCWNHCSNDETVVFFL